MAERPHLVLAMRPDVLDLVLSAPLRARLDTLASVHPALVTDGTDISGVIGGIGGIGVPDGPGIARISGVTEIGGTNGIPAARDSPAAATLSEVLADTEVLLTGWGCPPLDAAFLDRAPRLTAVIHAAGSVKGHVRPEVWQRGITVSSAADVNAGPVIEFTLATLWLAARRTLGTAADYTRGRIPEFDERRGADGAVIGVIGASRIGRGVITRLLASPFGYRVLLADPYVSPAQAAALGAELTDLDTLCRAADIVTVHAPDLPDTYHLLDARRLGLLKDGAAVVNTARGRLVDTEALTRECAGGRIDAYLDVTDPEPLPGGHLLHTLPNVLLTPHIAGCQGTEVQRLGAYAVDEVERWIRGEPLLGEIRADDLSRIA